MSPQAKEAWEYLLERGVPMEELVLGLRDRVQVLALAVKGGRGSGVVPIEIPISRGQGQAVFFVDKTRILADRS